MEPNQETVQETSEQEVKPEEPKVPMFVEFVRNVVDAATQIAIDDKEKKLSRETLLQLVSDKVEGMVKEKINVQFSEMVNLLNQYIQDKAEELSLETQNIAPYGDYGKLLENRDDMAEFLKKEAAKSENWRFKFVDAPYNQNHQLLQLAFDNLAVDEGETLQGFIFYNDKGKVKHYFVRGQD